MNFSFINESDGFWYLGIQTAPRYRAFRSTVEVFASQAVGASKS